MATTNGLHDVDSANCTAMSANIAVLGAFDKSLHVVAIM